ncbi:hypothetical protein BHE74_00031672 [Ensete ventricosum]|nr:hypothetical protein GW17_00021963 [Ensete ventricosum]RWW61275.1 hypothetical protein BHE74_00031672 [Ensete ventricosum]RZR87872.1 hypothetical protein BHM03_00015337 [Ensete ventricosum]
MTDGVLSAKDVKQPSILGQQLFWEEKVPCLHVPGGKKWLQDPREMCGLAGTRNVEPCGRAWEKWEQSACK